MASLCRHALMGVIEQVEEKKFKNDENEKCYMVFDLALALSVHIIDETILTTIKQLSRRKVKIFTLIEYILQLFGLL